MDSSHHITRKVISFQVSTLAKYPGEQFPQNRTGNTMKKIGADTKEEENNDDLHWAS